MPLEAEGPIEPEFEAKMRSLANLLEDVFNGELTGNDRRVGFALLLFKFGSGDDHRANYISNAERADMLAVLKEFIARNEGRYIPFDPTKKA